MKRHLIILAAVIAVGAVVPLPPLGGQRIVGFRYGVIVDNLSTECPNTVVSVEGSRVTLDDWRVLVVKGPDADWLEAEFKDCEDRVRFDANERTLHTMRRVGFCGFDRPQHNQLITIPLIRVDMHKYTSRQFAEAREVQPMGGH